jgi:hypothetical protein
MGKFSGVLLASDFDNTLIYTSAALLANVPAPSLSDENRKALEYFMAEGGKFAIATGRALVGFAKYAPSVPMNAPGVICNGAALYDFSKGEYLETAMLDETALRRGQAILNRFPQVAVEAYHTDNVIHAVQPNDVTRQHLHITKVGITETSSLLEVPLPLGKLLFEADHETLEAVRDYIADRNWLGDYEVVFSTDFLLEMTAKGANKGGMVRRLAAFLGISMDHVYCAGDEANDISMLTAAAEGFAPANCNQAVRDCGATIVAHAQDNAIAEVVEILDKRYS